MVSHPYDELPKATVQIYGGEYDGQGDGSGFHLKDDDIVVTNSHVVQPYFGTDPIYARTESGETSQLDIIGHSLPEDQGGYDYAVCRCYSDLGSDRIALSPKRGGMERGDQVLFSGFPHGIDSLLVHRGVVSGPRSNGFAIDGSVNSGNSGGPVIEKDSGEVVGIVTSKRFVSPQKLQSLQANWKEIRSHVQGSQGTIGIMGLTSELLRLQLPIH